MIKFFKKYKKNVSTFLFYDYETFGTNPASDKPSQFACIRTDINFNIIDKPKISFCYPPIDYLPNPEAILITGITPQKTFLDGYNEFYFSKYIYNIFNIGNTCIIGYNNIRFDDEITRNIFYRNLLDPYSWSWKNNNSRWDLLGVLRTYYAIRPNGINWPINEIGMPSFKLENISKANNISHTTAHDALSDVYATVLLAKFLKEKNAKLFKFLFEIRAKEKLLNLIDINNMKPVFYVSGLFGASRSNISLISPILRHPKNNNILIGIDLTKNILCLINYLKQVNTKTLNYNELFSLGFLFIYLNRCPILVPLNCLLKKDLNRLNINKQNCFSNLYILKETPSIKNYILFFLNYNHGVLPKDIDLTIYDSFFCNQDKSIIEKLHIQLPLNNVDDKFSFRDNRIKKILFRCKARNFPVFLKDNENKKWLKYCNTVLNKKLMSNYRLNIKFLLKKYNQDEEKIFLLKELLIYSENLESYILNF
ncbi:exodeoxyribonuclease I [Buchnera aphidicola (Pemphigus obesinymphae)]|uniref:exodeoxyribonuclease I n=1 Tax=Buchnera aphidicola TaxID=9 RepID=UPI0022371285|nr:exodeoxyribonuclease I [Buchnera aphidicola]MCW5196451.1 exodeoxyribonuclease I [Buchnera aphidicola (Pemphigus obesinymphae)]